MTEYDKKTLHEKIEHLEKLDDKFIDIGAYFMAMNLVRDLNEIAKGLAECTVFALNHGKWSSDSFVMNPVTGRSTTPIYFFADALAKYGVTYDRADLAALHLPAAKRRKYFSDKKKQASTRESDNG